MFRQPLLSNLMLAFHITVMPSGILSVTSEVVFPDGVPVTVIVPLFPAAVIAVSIAVSIAAAVFKPSMSAVWSAAPAIVGVKKAAKNVITAITDVQTFDRCFGIIFNILKPLIRVGCNF